MEKISAHEDRTIVLLRNKLRQQMDKEKEKKDSLVIGSKEYALVPTDIENIFSIMLPEIFQDMDEKYVRIRYPSTNRPDVIKSAHSHEVLTFNALTTEGKGKDIFDKILYTMQKIYKHNIFYGNGETCCSNGIIYWEDYKGFNLKGCYYGLVFLADSGSQRKVWGSFYGSIKEFDIWKPAVIKLLETIHIEEFQTGRQEDEE